MNVATRSSRSGIAGDEARNVPRPRRPPDVRKPVDVRRHVLRWPSYVLRTVAILAVTLAATLAYIGLRLAALTVRDPDRRATAVARARGRVLRWAMSTLGATFIKLGQVMSSRPDLFAPAMIDELRKLQDRLPQFSFRRVERILAADLGPGAHFASIEATPVAAASVAQVHRAVLPDGTVVAVKVLRPDVRRKAERDGAILVAVARLLELVPEARLSEPVAHVRHFVAGIVEQTDLRNEAVHYERFRANFARQRGVVFPRVHQAWSSERVLTMDFIEGTKLDALGPGPHRAIAHQTRSVFFQMCFEDGFVHADLHPGNLLLTAEGKVAIFDVGLVKRIDDAVLTQLVDFARCLAVGTAHDFVAHLRRFHQYMAGTDWDAVERDAGRFIGRFRGKTSSELEMGQLINGVFAMSRAYQIRPIADLTLILVGIVTTEGIAKTLDPEVDMFRELAAYLMPVLEKRGIGVAA
jgi:ubiquinone biosynthesis protein